MDSVVFFVNTYRVDTINYLTFEQPGPDNNNNSSIQVITFLLTFRAGLFKSWLMLTQD